MRKLLIHSLVLCGLLAFWIPAEAAMMRLDVPSSAYEAYAQDPMFQSSGWLAQLDASGGMLDWGSAVLIDPHWILFTGHEVVETTFSSLAFGLGPNILTNPGETRTLSATYVYPGYIGGRGNDIALGYFEDPILSVAPAERYRGSDELGMNGTMLGFGTPGTLATGLLPDDGAERAGTNIIDKVGWTAIGISTNYLLADFHPVFPGYNPLTPLEWCSTSGDSGGAWFNDAGQVFGLGAFHFNSYGYSGGIRVSYYNDWVDDTIAAHTSVPEPGSLVMLSTGFAVLVCLRRRRWAR